MLVRALSSFRDIPSFAVCSTAGIFLQEGSHKIENILVVKHVIDWLTRSQKISENSKKKQSSLHLHYSSDISIYLSPILLHIVWYVHMHPYT